jgi:acetolactate synthase small subunit
LKKSFIKKRFNKLLKQKEEQREVSNDEVYTVGIIASGEIYKWMKIENEVERILGLGNVRIYNYRPFNKMDIPSYKYFSEKDFNWKGEPKNKFFKSFIEEPHDLLIGYFNKNNLYIENAVLRSNAKFKVGFANVNQALYDMEIAEYPTKVESFLSELKKYLIIMNKLKN